MISNRSAPRLISLVLSIAAVFAIALAAVAGAPPAQAETLAEFQALIGEDADKNGVRDDVDAFLAKYLAKEPNLIVLAMLYQMSFHQPYATPQEVAETDCPPQVHRRPWLKDLYELTFNTPERQARRKAFDVRVKGCGPAQ